MMDWVWIDGSALCAAHDISIRDHGGLSGIKNQGAIDAALARPQQLYAYGDPPPDAAALAATYAFGLAKGHGFNDGNKRAGWLAARAFMILNGYRLVVDQPSAVQMMLGLAAGTVTEEDAARWFRQRSTKK